MFYITVGKRKTRLVLATCTACVDVAEALRKRLGRPVAQLPLRWTDVMWDARPRNERYRAGQILKLVKGWMPKDHPLTWGTPRD